MNKLSTAILIITVSLLWMPGKAQESRFKIGVEGGPALTNLYGNKQNKNEFTNTLGGYAGILFQYGFTDHIFLRTGITYERMGTHYQLNPETAGAPVTYTADSYYKFDYIAIPVRAKAAFGRKVRFCLEAGPYFSYLINQKYIAKTSTGDHDYTEAVEDITPKSENSIDYGLSGGISVEFGMGRIFSLNIGILDYLGLCNTHKQPIYYTDLGQPLNSETNSYNNTAIFFVGFMMNIGK
jgi:hypothetical protein